MNPVQACTTKLYAGLQFAETIALLMYRQAVQRMRSWASLVATKPQWQIRVNSGEMGHSSHMLGLVDIALGSSSALLACESSEASECS